MVISPGFNEQNPDIKSCQKKFVFYKKSFLKSKKDILVSQKEV
jgi:hypothetical protein